MQESSLIKASANPFDLFADWFEEAKASEPADPNAMILATVGQDGFPTARAMLMKGFDEKGFVFFTNQLSRKSEQIRSAGKVGLCFYWKSLYRQVHIEGPIAPISAAESDEYFATRPRASQIGAWASKQSRPLEGRSELEGRIEKYKQRFEGGDVPRPPHWGGYRVTPLRMEFWLGHEFRLHDRVVYSRASEQEPWTTGRLFP